MTDPSRERLKKEIAEIIYEEVLIAGSDSYVHADDIETKFLAILERERRAAAEEALEKIVNRLGYDYVWLTDEIIEELFPPLP